MLVHMPYMDGMGYIFLQFFLGSIVVSARGRRGAARGEVLQSSRRLKRGFGFGFDEKLEAISPAKDGGFCHLKRVSFVGLA